MKFSILFLLITAFVRPGFAQTEEEIEAMMKKAQSVIDKSGGSSGDEYLTGFEDTDPDELLLKIPPRNATLLAALPKKILTRTEVAAYVTAIRSQLVKKMNPGRVAAANAAIKALDGKPEPLYEQSISTWYNGLQQEAMLMLLEALQKNPNDPLLLNNLAAFLNLGGAPQKAIPILKSLLSEHPKNTLILNNLGQSFANLGEADSALYYLGKCLKLAPMHASANHTTGVIEAAKGDKTTAEAHLSNAIRSARDPQSIAALKMLNPLAPVDGLLKPKFKMPGDFNPLKYQYPPQLEDASQEKLVQMQHQEFWENMNEVISQYSAAMDEEGSKGENILSQRIAAAQKDALSESARSLAIVRPFTPTANAIMIHLQTDLAAQAEDLRIHTAALEKKIQERMEKFHKTMETLSAEYKEKYDKLPICGEGHCGAEELRREYCKKETEVTNAALKDMAVLRRDIQEKMRLTAFNKFELMSYWGYLGGANEGFANAAYYGAVHDYLAEIEKGAVTQYLNPPCVNLPDVEVERQIPAEPLAKTFCPVNLTVPMIVAKLKLDCEKFSISGGEGIRFKYEKEFTSGASTISMGIGVGFDAGVGGSVSAGVSGEITEGVYIRFDKDNNVVDGGLEMNAKLTAQTVGSSNGVKVTGITELKGGYRMGVESGINFTGNAFKILK